MHLGPIPPTFHEVVLPAFLLLALGWLIGRRKILGPDAATALSRLAVDFCFPALAFSQILRTVGEDGVRMGFAALVLSCLVLAGAVAVGLGAGRLSGPSRGPTVAFLIATPNWIFLPLPIAPSLWGPSAEGSVLWMNLPAQVMIWTVGVGLLHAQRPDGGKRPGLRAIPGLVGTIAGIAAGLAWPGLREIATEGYRPESVLILGLSVGLHALRLLGGLTIPLSFLIMGAQLAAARLHPRAWDRNLALVLAGRLVAAPLLFLVISKLVPWDALPIARQVPFTALLISAMPCAISCGSIVERFGGDSELTAQSVVASTAASLLTVPILLRLGGAV